MQICKTREILGIGLVTAYAACTAVGAVRASFDAASIVSNGAYPSKALKRLHRKFIYDRKAQVVTIRDEEEVRRLFEAGRKAGT